jgi:hypothetical protein
MKVRPINNICCASRHFARRDGEGNPEKHLAEALADLYLQ